MYQKNVFVIQRIHNSTSLRVASSQTKQSRVCLNFQFSSINLQKNPMTQFSIFNCHCEEVRRDNLGFCYLSKYTLDCRAKRSQRRWW